MPTNITYRVAMREFRYWKAQHAKSLDHKALHIIAQTFLRESAIVLIGAGA